MYQNDTDLQGTDGSGILGGPDVRRRIPIKLISKQPVRNKAVNHSQRPLSRLPSKTQSNDEEGFGFKQEDRFERKSGDALGNQRRFPQPVFWDYKLNLVGEKDDTPVHFCEICGLPIKLYGRMIPCKHVFCYDCALLHEKKMEKMCPGLTIYSCTDPVQRIEQCLRGLLYMCSIVPGCKRTYLSQRDLQAHVNHRHMRASKAAGGGILPRLEPLHPQLASEPPDHFRRLPLPHLAKGHPLIPPQLQGHDPYGQPPHASPSTPSSELGPSGLHRPPLGQETFRIATLTTRKHSNLITVPIQDDSGDSPLPQPAQGMPPPHQHQGDYPGQPHHLMALPPQQQHYGPPPQPPPTLSHSMQHLPQGSGTSHLVYNQVPPMSSGLPPITPPPGHIMGQMPPYMNHPPPPGPLPQHGGPPVNTPPPHHYNPSSMQQDRGTLSPPFNQPGGLSPGMWPAPRGTHPPRMQGPPPHGQMPGPPQHTDQSRYHPYYQ
nr:E3 ubiquitin-protein ligase Hakai-like isoform X1 [Oncorhynchus nerka]